jgi:hypothetical protein
VSGLPASHTGATQYGLDLIAPQLVAFVLSTYMNAGGVGRPPRSRSRKARVSDVHEGQHRRQPARSAGLLEVDCKRGQRRFLYTAVIPGSRIPRRDGNESLAELTRIPRRDEGESVESEKESVTTTRARARGKKSRANAHERDYSEYDRA